MADDPQAGQPPAQQTQQPAQQPGQQPPDPGQQQQPQTLWPHTIGEPEPPPEPTPEPTPEQKRLQELEQQVQAQQERERHYQSTLESLMAQRYPAAQPAAQAPQQQPAQQQQPLFTTEGLPDPVSNPTEYNNKLQERINAALQQNQQSTTQVYEQMARGQALDSVWNRFTSQHADLAKHDLLVNGASQQLMSELKSRGVDPVQVAMQNPDTLVHELANRVQGALQSVSGGQQTGQGQPPASGQGQPPQAPQQYQQGVPRTQGFAAGSTTPQAPQQQQQPPSFTEQLKKAQSDTGIL